MDLINIQLSIYETRILELNKFGIRKGTKHGYFKIFKSYLPLLQPQDNITIYNAFPLQMWNELDKTMKKLEGIMNEEIIMINIGYGNILHANRMIAIVDPDSAPIKRAVQDAREQQKLIDSTFGSKTRSVIIMDSGHIVLSAIQPETVAQRI